MSEMKKRLLTIGLSLAMALSNTSVVLAAPTQSDTIKSITGGGYYILPNEAPYTVPNNPVFPQRVGFNFNVKIQEDGTALVNLNSVVKYDSGDYAYVKVTNGIAKILDDGCKGYTLYLVMNADIKSASQLLETRGYTGTIPMYVAVTDNGSNGDEIFIDDAYPEFLYDVDSDGTIEVGEYIGALHTIDGGKIVSQYENVK